MLQRVRATASMLKRTLRNRLGLTVPASTARKVDGLSKAEQAQLAGPGRRVVTDGRRTVVADANDAVSPWTACAELSARVESILLRQQVEHWTVHQRGSRVSHWAVRQQDFVGLFAELAVELESECYYLRSEALGPEPRLIEECLEALGSEPMSVQVFRYVRDPFGDVRSDHVACRISGWEAGSRGTLRAPNRAGVVHEIDDVRPIATTRVLRWDGTTEPRLAALAVPDSTEIDFAIDAVYLWVDGSDPEWRDRRDGSRRRLLHQGRDESPEALADFRYRDRGELRASLRSLEFYAPWFRQVYLVTDSQRPAWLDPASSRIQVVDHRDIFEDPHALPSFNSQAIGSQLHRIQGLAEHYLVMNDDIMFNRPASPYDFFTPEGLMKVVKSRSRMPLVDTSKLTPLESARRNSASLIERDHGRRVTQLFAHVPIPQTREVANEVATRYRPEIAQTVRHPFRSPDDVEVNSWLHLNVALLTGRAVVSRQRFAYFDIGDDSARRRMRRRGEFADALTVCVNDSGPADDEEVSRWYSDWLRRAFPVAAAHELPPERGAVASPDPFPNVYEPS